MKRCTKCGELKPLDMFSKDKSRKDGRRPICSECDSAYRKSYRAAHLEEVREYERRVTADHADAHRARVKAWAKANPEKVRENQLRWVAANLEKVRESKRRTSNPERVRRWIAGNMDRLRKIKSRWKSNNPEAVRQSSRNRRAHILGSNEKITAQEWEDLKRKYNYACLCCKRREPEIRLTLDHVKPLVQGGANSIRNAQPLCRSCNSAKGKKWIDYR